jgi:hypothetical protein
MADVRLELASRMPSQVPWRIAKFDVSLGRPRWRAQQTGGAMKQTAGWPKGRRSV